MTWSDSKVMKYPAELLRVERYVPSSFEFVTRVADKTACFLHAAQARRFRVPVARDRNVFVVGSTFHRVLIRFCYFVPIVTFFAYCIVV